MKHLVIAFCAFLLLIPSVSKADHNAGGELTWTCITSGPDAGKFKFRLALYRFCEGIALGSSALIQSNSPAGSFTATRISVTDVSPKCYLGQEIDCTDPNKDGWAIDEHIYESAAIPISGIPPASGWEFYWSSCCRPAPAIYLWGYLVDNLEPQNQSYRIRAVMYPYQNRNTNPCYDNSPRFSEKPVTIICAGYPFTYNHNAVDVDLDSLTYEWTAALLSTGAPVSYATNFNTNQVTPRPNGGNFIVPAPGFSPSVPLPWSHPNMNTSNVPASLDLISGEIRFTSFTLGQYATSIKVNAWRCQVKIAEVMRDIPVLLLDCPPAPGVPPIKNLPPDIIFKDCPSCTAKPLPAGDTVYAGDSVSFYIQSSDLQFLPGFVSGQTNYLYPNGSQFGTGYIDSTTGCNNPPCAILDQTQGGYSVVGGPHWEGQFGLTTNFFWRTSCNHLAQSFTCFQHSNTYSFVFKVLDNWCPAPGTNFSTFTVTVVAPPAIPAPRMTCANVLPSGQVNLKWSLPLTKAEDSLNSFRKYIIYRASSATGPYDTLHIVTKIDSIEYLDLTANALTSAKYYFIQGISSCNDQAKTISSDTISSLRLLATVINSGNSVALDWNDFNPGNRWGATTKNKYYIWGIVGPDTTLLDSTIQSVDTLEVHYCFPTTANFMITVEDTTKTWGCITNSTISGGAVGDNTPPPPSLLDSLSYALNGQIHMSWTASTPDIKTFYIYKGATLVDSVANTITSYTYTPSASDPCQLAFSIAARDSCGNTGIVGVGQTAMCTQILDVIRCDTNKMIVIGWNTYNPGWAGGSALQQVWRSVNGGPWMLHDSVLSTVNQYADTNIAANTTYAYRIRSRENGPSARGAWADSTSYNIANLIKGTIIGAPDLRCVSWLDDNTIRLYWNKPTNVDTNFNKYMIYHSTASATGPWTLIDSIRGIFTSDNLAYDSVGYTHNGANPNDLHFYQIKSSSGCSGQELSSASATLQAVNLVIGSTTDSLNTLEWNQVRTTASFPSYTIYRDNGLLGSTPFGSETFDDIEQACHLDVQYQVSYPDLPGGCESKSRIIDASFIDDTPSAKQFVDSVSMLQDSSFTGLVGWKANNSKDVVRYYVLNCLGSSYKMLDTIPSTAPFFFTDVLNAPLNDVTSYSVVAEDSCGNSQLSSANFDCHKTMFIDVSMNFCDQSMVLDWNGYDDFASGTNVEYRIILVNDNGTMNEVGRTTETKFEYSGLENGERYCFIVQGWENDGAGPMSSSSAMKCLTARFIQPPTYAEMNFVTVADSNLVRMCMRIDINSDIEQYWVIRSLERDKNYKVIGTVSLPSPVTLADSIFCFEDAHAETSKHDYYYRVQAIDPCGELAITSTHGRTILLKVHADNGKNINVLTWNKYELWKEGVEEYQIYRGTNFSGLSKVETLKTNSLKLRDDVKETNDNISFFDKVTDQSSSGNGEFCYQVVAIRAESVTSSHNSSRSNVECTIQQPLFYSPTAFTPNGDGLNDYFKPYGAFVDNGGYTLEVYNGWGQRIFRTDDYTSPGWDGTYQGQPVPTDTYIFKVSYQAADGQTYSEEGSVTITR